MLKKNAKCHGQNCQMGMLNHLTLKITWRKQNHLAKKYSISYQKNTKIAMMIVKKF
jgi:hypothetical protein